MLPQPSPPTAGTGTPRRILTNAMAILALGISYRGASVELLDRLAFSEGDAVKAYRRAADDESLEEAVLLSTCNRVELYASVGTFHAGFLSLKRLLCETRGVEPDEIAEPLYSHYEESAVEHLFTVAAGLDSMVLGEPQILAQVREAHRLAQAEGGVGPVLTALFHAGARTGRRVRTETAVGAVPDAFVEAGAALAEQTLGPLEGRRAIVIGAGHMAALAVKHLRSRGAGPIRVLNRSLERARALAERTSTDHGGLADLPHSLAGSDLIVSATGATGVVLDAPAVAEAMTERADRPLFLLDLAVPRDVDPSVAQIQGVTLVDISGLREALEARTAGLVEIERSREIVREEVRRFSLRRRSEHLAPLIKALRERGNEVMTGELQRFRSDLAGLTPDERAAVEALARSIVSKLLHDPIVGLKERSSPGTEQTHARLLADLFGIDPPS